MARNASDEGNRRYILVQLPEPLDPDNADQKVAADYCGKIKKPKNIAELTKERLRRAGKAIKKEYPQYSGDLGFRVFRLASSNIRAWEPDRDNLAATLKDAVEHLKSDRTEQDVLYELLLKLGLDLCVPIETKKVAGKTAHSIGGGVLIVCLAPKIARQDAEPLGPGIVDWRKELAPAGDTTCVFRDSAFADDGGLEGRGKAALDAMNPVCTLRYSATHADKHHMVFRLDAVDAYERKLVKQIEVASATIENAHNRPFVRLVSVANKRGVISAKVEMDVETAAGVQRREIIVQDGDNLEQTTKRVIYADSRIGEIRVAKGNEYLELRVPGGEHYLKPGETWGDVDALAVQREMIRRTIKEHLDKEKRLRPQGIKVLSLFFIDVVDRYRRYDADGNPLKGAYARIFEEEYGRLGKHPDYQTLFAEVDLTRAAEEVHNGYFSIDKKGGWTDTEENNQANRDNAERAYNLIMKEKEKLLSFETPLKFIFSHSALREGWDNPNVFQICTLRDIQTERERRQTIGRGLRLCVNQKGERLHGFEVNTLTVVATESYEQFAENLQKEIEDDTGIRFGVLEAHQFAAIAIQGEDGQTKSMGFEESKALWEHLKGAGLIDSRGKVQDSLKKALKDGTFTVPTKFAAQQSKIVEILRKLSGRLEIKNADERRQVRTRQAVLHSAEFTALWDRIKQKTPTEWNSTTRSWSRAAFGRWPMVRRSRRPDCNGARRILPSGKPVSRPRNARAPRLSYWTRPTLSFPIF
jgi:hypothetical protein